jgi:hypothetical protein
MMMHSETASVYPKAGCLRIGRSLYSIRGLYTAVGKHLWGRLICNDAQPHTQRYFMNNQLYVGFNMGEGMCRCLKMDTTIAGVTPVVHVWRIQRAIRRTVQQRAEERALALSMGLHARLGSHSQMAELPADVAAAIIGYAVPLFKHVNHQ